jgi:ATP-binding cassette subfamily B protein
MQLLDSKPAITDGPGELRQVRGAIQFRDVHLDFAASPVLQGASLTVAPGERVAIVGASGSGKSVLAALVPRFHDVSAGAVLVDGQDVRELTLASLRRHIGVAFEDAFLFSDTVRANIAYGRPGATDAEIEAAAVAAAAHEFISELPKGYQTTVGERGMTLSGGQRQRIALARAILTDPAILILDDATSAVDAQTEEQIHDALRHVLAGRTTLLIAHRMSTLRLADRIVVLDAGRVQDSGTHAELLDRNAIYRGLLSGVDELPSTIDELATITAGTVTASAWRAQRRGAGPMSTAPAFGAPSLGAGLGGGHGRGGGGGWHHHLAPTPELLAKVAALPPVRDTATLDLAAETRRNPAFSLRTLLREFRRAFWLGFTLVVIDALLGVVGPVFVRIGIDDGVVRKSSTVLAVAALALLAVTLAGYVNQIGETFVTGRPAERVMLSLRVRIWAQLQRLSLDYYEREMGGRIMTRMTSDVDQFQTLIENGLLNALVAFVTFVGVGVALLIMNVELALWTFTVIVPLAVATAVFRRVSAQLYDRARDLLAIANADFQESLSGVREAQAFVHEGASRARFHGLGADYLQVRVAAQRLIAVSCPFVQVLAAIADAVVLGVGARLIGASSLTAGALIAFVLYIDMFFSPIQQLSQVFDAWQQTRVSVKRIAELMVLDTLTPPPVEPVPFGRLSGATDVHEVHFAYPGVAADAAARKPPEALRGVDFAVRAGQTIALVGETGAGKSTVMKLIARFYDPDSGAVLASGHDLRTLDLQEFRGQLGYVPQESFLFTGSVRDNIAYGRPAASDAQVEAAARSVGAHEFIAALPGGYLHELTERGKSLSAGQRQLIALARAELVDPALLLLDEATANLDLVTEAHVAAAMQNVTARRTTIVIAHRLQTARTAETIVVLDHGMVAEAGSHSELLELGGHDAAMWQAFELVGSQ